jgi:hypothetical protein
LPKLLYDENGRDLHEEINNFFSEKKEFLDSEDSPGKEKGYNRMNDLGDDRYSMQEFERPEQSISSKAKYSLFRNFALKKISEI